MVYLYPNTGKVENSYRIGLVPESNRLFLIPMSTPLKNFMNVLPQLFELWRLMSKMFCLDLHVGKMGKN